jgi:hypothetical protein
MIFTTAHQVRLFLRLQGFTDFRVRFGRNPFGGTDRFIVCPTHLPEGVSVIYSGGSQQPDRYFTSDGGVTAGIFARLQEALRGSNAFVST